MMTFKWCFTCDATEENKDEIAAILDGRCHDIARFACIDPLTLPIGRIGNPGIIIGYAETFIECTVSLCQALLTNAKWSPALEGFTELDANKFFDNPSYLCYYADGRGVVGSKKGISSLGEGAEFGQSLSSKDNDDCFMVEESEFVFEDSIDFAATDFQTSSSAFEIKACKNNGLQYRDSHYTSESIAKWTNLLSTTYSNILASNKYMQDNEEKLQSSTPLCFPFSTYAIEFRRYHLQLTMLRGSFEQLLGHFLSCLLYHHPFSLWHRHTSTDEILMQYFVAPPNAYELTYNNDLIDLGVDTNYRAKPSFYVFHGTGGTMQPFCRAWRGMISIPYKPGIKPLPSTSSTSTQTGTYQSNEFSLWDQPLSTLNNSGGINTAKSDTNATHSYLDHFSKWTIDSETWFSHAVDNSWELFGSTITRSLADLAELCASRVLRVTTAQKQSLYEYALALHPFKHSSSERLDLQKLRSAHLNQRCCHLIISSCYILSHIHDISSCVKEIGHLPVRWMTSVLFNTFNPREFFSSCSSQQSGTSPHLTIIINAYTKPNIAMALMVIMKYSFVLPTLLSLLLKRLVHDDNTRLEYENLMLSAHDVQKKVCVMCCGDYLNSSNQRKQVTLWLSSVFVLIYQLLSYISGVNVEAAAYVDADIELRRHDFSTDQSYSLLVVSANQILFKIEECNDIKAL